MQPDPRSRAKPEIAASSFGSNACPATRRTGVSIEIAPTGTATRISGAPATAVWISAKLTVARPGASGTSVRPLSVCAQSPSSFHKWLSA